MFFGWVLISSALTIAKTFGSSDVYSYPEDDSVLDPLLAEHLAHFGIDFSSMQKVSNEFRILHFYQRLKLRYSNSAMFV